MADKLRERVQLVYPINDPNDEGGFTTTYATLLHMWGAMKPIAWHNTYLQNVRSQQIKQSATHIFTIRRSSVTDGHAGTAFGMAFGPALGRQSDLGRIFSDDFSSSFDTVPDLAPIKADEYRLMLERNGGDYIRLFKILGVMDPNERREKLDIYIEEVEERGTGGPE